MGRLVAAAVLAAGILPGCVTPDSNRRPYPVHTCSRTYPRYEIDRAEAPPARVEPTARRPRVSYDKSWLPHGRRISPRWTTIVIHHSATERGGAKSFDRYHRKRGWDELGYHFVIGNGTDTPDGYVEVGPRWHKQKHGAHCKTPDNYFNEHGIGICLVGNFNETRPTRRQLASLARLVRFLSHQCGISPSQVTTHSSVTHKTQCPGRNFPLAALRRSLSRSATASSLP